MRLLDDIKVLDLGGFIAGPYTATLLADFGAEVIKVEKPGIGDPFRALRDDLYSPQFQAHNCHKRSVTLDYTRPEGHNVLRALVARSDVLIVNSRPHVAEKFGIGHASLHEVNPRLIYCSITGFGPDGPYAERPAFDYVGQALSGWMSRHRTNDDPRVVGPAIADRITSLYAALGVVSALHERHTSGVGRLVEVNMLEANVVSCMEPIVQCFATGEPVPVYLRGAFSQAYSLTCRDGKRIGLHLSSPDKFWHGLCRAIERPEWIQKYPKLSDRVKAYETLAVELSQIFGTRERAEWAVVLEQQNVPFAPEREVQELEDDPQIRHLGLFYELDHPRHGPVKLARRPVHVDSSRTIDARPPPALGEHTDEVLREAGVSPNDIEQLRKSGIV